MNDTRSRFLKFEWWMYDLKLNLSELKILMIICNELDLPSNATENKKGKWINIDPKKRKALIKFTKFGEYRINRALIKKGINSLIEKNLITLENKNVFRRTENFEIKKDQFLITDEIKILIKRVKDYEIELIAMRKAIEGLEETCPAAQKTLDKKEVYYKKLLSELEATGYEEE